MEQLCGILEKVTAILAQPKVILEKSGLFLAQWEDKLEHQSFIRTNIFFRTTPFILENMV